MLKMPSEDAAVHLSEITPQLHLSLNQRETVRVKAKIPVFSGDLLYICYEIRLNALIKSAEKMKLFFSAVVCFIWEV